MRSIKRVVLTCGLLAAALAVARAPVAGQAKAKETFDQKIKNQLDKKMIKIREKESLEAACARDNDVTITSTTDGDVALRPGETKFFRIDKKKDDFTRSGGWYWRCGGSPEKSRINEAEIIKAVRKDSGAITWTSVKVDVAD